MVTKELAIVWIHANIMKFRGILLKFSEGLRVLFRVEYCTHIVDPQASGNIIPVQNGLTLIFINNLRHKKSF